MKIQNKQGAIGKFEERKAKYSFSISITEKNKWLLNATTFAVLALFSLLLEVYFTDEESCG